MNNTITNSILAKTLGKGVEIAALKNYSEWDVLLNEYEKNGETLGGVVLGDNETSFASYELLPVQKFVEEKYEEIEICVSAHDGYNELSVNYYVRHEYE